MIVHFAFSRQCPYKEICNIWDPFGTMKWDLHQGQWIICRKKVLQVCANIRSSN